MEQSMISENPFPQRCDVCDYETATEEHSGSTFGRGPRKVNLCFFCSHTFISNVYIYEDQYPNQLAVARSIGWIANWFADQLNLKREP